MAKFECRHRNRLQGVYDIAYQENNVAENINPRELLQEQLNQFIGQPNTEAARAAIESILLRYNFVYNERLTMDDLNIW